MPSSQHALDEAGFTGFVRFGELPSTSVPAGPGVYAVVRPTVDPPTFRAVSPAGHFKGRDPSVSIEKLRAKWVPGVEVIYIGKATHGRRQNRGLRIRLEEYRRYGAGDPVAHQGGRYIWQIEDAEQLLVAWLETPNEDPGGVEAELLADFRRHTGALPFANLRAERAGRSTRP